MVKRIKKVIKGRPTRERKKIIVVGTEGKNKTEELYLRNLERTQKEYHFIFAGGNDTDPVRIVRNTINAARDEEISFKRGDMAVSIFDLDLSNVKREQVEQAKELSSAKGICLITSNPCFEIWFLEHFVYTSKPFNSNDELIRELKKYIPAYSKSANVFEALYPRTADAVSNCIKLDNYHTNNTSGKISAFCNPRTDVYKIVEMIIKERGA